ncbi:MFS transporter [Microbacterium sp.]|uniref:MFS transporter n=1 Tax=Microbacterium sp. TaxID=51671 RepID=UPI003F9573E9
MNPQDRRARRGLFAAFASLGVTASFFPAVIPAVELALGGDVSVAVPALFAGLLLGVLSAGPALRRSPARRVLIVGGVLQTLAIIAAALAATPSIFVIAAAVAGIGFGLVEASGSVAAKAISTVSATGLLSALTGTLAVAAAATPLTIVVSVPLPALSLLAALPLATVVLLCTTSDAATTQNAPTPLAVRRLVPLLPIALALPLYVGVETVISGWSAVIPERALTLDPSTAALGTTAFWMLMAIGRFGAAGLRRREVRPLVILAMGSLAAAMLLCACGLLIAEHPAWALAAVAASVIGLAPSYGLILGIALDRLNTSESAGVTGALVACGAIGGTFVPAAVLLIGRDPAAQATFILSAALCASVPLLVALGVRRPLSSPRPPRSIRAPRHSRESAGAPATGGGLGARGGAGRGGSGVSAG